MLVVALLFVGNVVLPWLPARPARLLIQTAFVLGLALGARRVLNVYFRDVQHLIGIVLQLWFYATPIVYPLCLVPRQAHLLAPSVPFRTLYLVNPMVAFRRVVPRPALRPAVAGGRPMSPTSPASPS